MCARNLGAVSHLSAVALKVRLMCLENRID